MIKLIHALRGDDPATLPDNSLLNSCLLDGALRAQLADAGVRRLQVNLDDADIAETALRLQAPTPTRTTPIRAVVSTWTEGPIDAVTAILGDLDPGVAGWRVDERIPTPPPVVPDGARAEALSNIAFIRRPAGTGRTAWLAHWHGPHTLTAVETQATFGYVQNVVAEPVTPGAPAVDGIVEELFPMAAMTDIHAFYGSGGDDDELHRRLTRLMDSVAILGADHDLDLVPTSRYLFHLD